MFSAKDSLRKIDPSLLVGTGVALVGVTACFAAARLVGQQLIVSAGGRGVQPVPLGAALLATVVGGAAAYGLARLAARSGRPRRTFAALTGVGLLLSAVPPLQAAADVGTAVWLLVLHGVVALAVLPTAARGLTSRQSPRSQNRRSLAAMLGKQEETR